MELVIRELVISYKFENYENLRIKLNVRAMHSSVYNYPIILKLKLTLFSTNHHHWNTCEGFMVEYYTLLTMALYGDTDRLQASLFLSGVEHDLAPKLTKKEINKLLSNTTCYKISL
jgi:hypothetical protein